ncbi:hypothetical protein [Caballeronia catudaia]|uniref:hypothetical protein n=1 Tax=Caballeronia catudaia TaxID=1777136 RepID=UPI00117D9D87|nr:hypothetical protein [Caballeronia catudaia]
MDQPVILPVQRCAVKKRGPSGLSSAGDHHVAISRRNQTAHSKMPHPSFLFKALCDELTIYDIYENWQFALSFVATC